VNRNPHDLRRASPERKPQPGPRDPWWLGLKRRIDWQVIVAVISAGITLALGITAFNLNFDYRPNPIPNRTTNIPVGTETAPSNGAASASPDEQEGFIKKINDERRNLYEGVASAQVRTTAEVRKPFTLGLAVCGAKAMWCSATESATPLSGGPTGSEEGQSRPTPTPPPTTAEANTPLGPVRLGGRVKVDLTAYQGGAEVQSTSPGV
jgi:hypothetical protein